MPDDPNDWAAWENSRTPARIPEVIPCCDGGMVAEYDSDGEIIAAHPCPVHHRKAA
jgi:hypothetical protein